MVFKFNIFLRIFGYLRVILTPESTQKSTIRRHPFIHSFTKLLKRPKGEWVTTRILVLFIYYIYIYLFIYKIKNKIGRELGLKLTELNI